MLDIIFNNVYYDDKHETCTGGGVEMDRKEISTKLRALRGGRSREQVAKACGISVSALAMYELGERIPRDTIKIKLANYYNSSVTAIFFAEEEHRTCTAIGGEKK